MSFAATTSQTVIGGLAERPHDPGSELEPVFEQHPTGPEGDPWAFDTPDRPFSCTT